MEHCGFQWFQCDENEAGPKLRHTIICGLQDTPFSFIPKLGQFLANPCSVPREFGLGESRDILQHYGSGLNVPDQPNGLWKQIALIVLAELFAGNGKRRAWNTTC